MKYRVTVAEYQVIYHYYDVEAEAPEEAEVIVDEDWPEVPNKWGESGSEYSHYDVVAVDLVTEVTPGTVETGAVEA